MASDFAAPVAPAAPTPARAASATSASFAPERVREPVRLPISSGEGPRVLHVQVLLGAAGFSPGVLDGKWQAGTRAAVRAFREAHALGEGAAVDEATYERLLEVTHRRPPVVEYQLTRADVRGPLRKIPPTYPGKAKLDCLCYETVGERVAERFHTTPAILKALNPGVVLDSATVGTVVHVPNVWRMPAKAPARLVVDKQGGTLRGYADDGALLFSLRASVGSAQTPSPTGRLKVLSVTRNPWYQYNPRVLSGKSTTKGAIADLPPGPNSPVGVVWIQLSKAHVGIHGTPEPARVGSAQSHGCVRLTNWDALFLASALTKGTAVEFN
ncbi:L,D-transpeptidase [Roseisolibacter sp. H3M3-2]|uniref:L,D-transpeptidase family protein n=1 Tax=Roseisolibacter sp. H3M3-2 TaxID=3031323 RepID=UPI0023D9BFC1|nr:L,D-transpeptidase [Roseisolibacter sp. H3M3-2]MDF1506374.1 L,D-transpeptidase [Roseisolibacter sp. H3M3-2]